MTHNTDQLSTFHGNLYEIIIYIPCGYLKTEYSIHLDVNWKVLASKSNFEDNCEWAFPPIKDFLPQILKTASPHNQSQGPETMLLEVLHLSHIYIRMAGRTVLKGLKPAFIKHASSLVDQAHDYILNSFPAVEALQLLGKAAVKRRPKMFS